MGNVATFAMRARPRDVSRRGARPSIAIVWMRCRRRPFLGGGGDYWCPRPWDMLWFVDVPATPFLDTFIFQVTFGAGYTFLDRCGQTMVDIERARPEWLASTATPMSGVMTNEVLRTNLAFNWDRFEIHVLRFQDNLEQ